MEPEDGLPQWLFPTGQRPSPTSTSQATLAVSIPTDPTVPYLSLPRLSSPIFSQDFLLETWGVETPEQEQEQEQEQETEASFSASILLNHWQPPQSSSAELRTQPGQTHSVLLHSTPPNRTCAIGAMLNHLTAAVKSRQLRERIARLRRSRAAGSAPARTPTPPLSPRAPHTETPPPDYATEVAHGELLLQIEDMVIVAPPVYAVRELPPAYPVWEEDEPSPRARIHSPPEVESREQYATPTTTTRERVFQTATAAEGVDQTASPDIHQWVTQRWRECAEPCTIGGWLHETHPIVARHWAEHDALALHAEAVGRAAFGRASIPPSSPPSSQRHLPGPSRLAVYA